MVRGIENWGGSVRIRANPVIVLREEFENHAFLYDPDTGDTFPVNPVGVCIWKKLDGSHTVERLVENLKQHFENVPGSGVDDIITFLKNLSKRGFIRE